MLVALIVLALSLTAVGLAIWFENLMFEDMTAARAEIDAKLAAIEAAP